MYHIWEFDGVSDEEDWQIVSDQIIVSVFGVEFYCKPSGIAGCVGRSSCTDNCRETHKNRRLLLGVLKEFRASILCHALENLEVAVGTGTFGVNYALGDAFAVEVGEFLNQVYILQQYGSAFTNGEGILVVGDWDSLVCCKVFFFHNSKISFS